MLSWLTIAAGSSPCVSAVGPWLELLAKMLRLLEVPHHIETGVMVSAVHHKQCHFANNVLLHACTEYAMSKDGSGSAVYMYQASSQQFTNMQQDAVHQGPVGEQYAEHMLLAYTGGVTRQDNEQRIDFLARVRNQALKPLHWHWNHSDNGSNHINHGQSSSSSSHTYLHSYIQSSGSSSNSSSSGDGGDNATITDYDEDRFVFEADKVVFLNDVYFCAQHIHRLLAHEEANLACGLDYYQVSTAKHIPKALRKGMWGFQVCMLYLTLIL